MTNAIIRKESAVDLFGVQARAYNVIANTSTGRILNQKIGASRYYKEDGHNYRIGVELRFDDECRNGHESFSITGSINEETRTGRYQEYSSGCIHEEIVKHFPELTHLIRWHLVATDGPMHYLGNTLYHAGDRDCNGRAAGEPCAFDYALRFGDFPITYRMESKRFREFLQSMKDAKIDNIIEVQHKENATSTGYKFGPKFTVDGYPAEWHECPFGSIMDAIEFRHAFNNYQKEFITIPTAYSTGKARELDHARSTAVWPDATDEQLTLPRAELEKLLTARLPALLATFKADMLAAGFLWPDNGESGNGVAFVGQ